MLTLGLGWVWLAWRGLVAERRFALTIAVTFGLVGAQLVVAGDTGDQNYLGYALTAVVAAACFAAYAQLREWVVLAGGVIGAWPGCGSATPPTSTRSRRHTEAFRARARARTETVRRIVSSPNTVSEPVPCSDRLTDGWRCYRKTQSQAINIAPSAIVGIPTLASGAM